MSGYSIVGIAGFALFFVGIIMIVNGNPRGLIPLMTGVIVLGWIFENLRKDRQ